LKKKKSGVRSQKSEANRQKPTANRAFTLIETLVAMMILSISLVIILQLFSGGLKSVRISDEYSRAIFHAKEKMEEILMVDNLINGESDGEFEDGYKWYAEILYLEPEDEAEKKKLPVDRFRINLKVSWLEGEHEKNFEISTLKIGKLIKTEDMIEKEAK